MKNQKIKQIIILMIVLFFIFGALIPSIQASEFRGHRGIDKGPSYKPLTPLKKVTFVGFDEETLIDDYAYLAAVPTAVFNTGENLVSHPLLFYQDEIEEDEVKYNSLDAYKGVKYFMEDWMEYCGGELDKLTAINVDKSDLDNLGRDIKSNLNPSNSAHITGSDPYKIASDIVLDDWSYSKDVVVAVIDEEFEKPNNALSNEIEGTLPAAKIHTEDAFTLKQSNSLNPVFDDFTVDEEYKFIKAEVWWDSLIFAAGPTIPAGDPDVQLYCQQDGDWMQASAVALWNMYSPKGHETAQTYVYNPGPWRIGITDFPTESADIPKKDLLGGFISIQGSLLKAFISDVTYNVDITMWPGVDVVIPDTPPFGCSDVEIKVKWDNPNINLGFSLIGPSGEAIVTAMNETTEDYLKIKLNSLGEYLPGESYKISVFSMTDISSPVDFTVEYSWEQESVRDKADSLTNAAEGAVLASQLNAPLLYTSSSDLSDDTENALYKIGTKNIHLINLGKHLDKKVRQDLENIADVKKEYTKHDVLYDEIRDLSGHNDVIFTTIDPWTYWYLAELKPADETKAGLFVGPATYCAAHHGSPVLIIENHPELSSAAVWHNEFWEWSAQDRYHRQPSVAEMVYTGRRVYDFLKDNDFDDEGLETIITVADQYEIGISWDRMFLGVANAGRICGSPVDTTYWISRSMFYPALIFVNPGVENEVTLINGSISDRKILGALRKPFGSTLTITRDSQEEIFTNPVLCSFVSHKHRFNERASKYYGTPSEPSYYQCADGLTPGFDDTMEAIDVGLCSEYQGKDGSCFPDMTETEIVPVYLDRGGYDTAFSTSLDAVQNNLNQGVILWIHDSHGQELNGGQTLFWDAQNSFNSDPIALIAKIFGGPSKQDNPWRGYDWLLGSTKEPDAMTMDIKGIIPFTNIRLPGLPSFAMDWAVARKPVRELLNKLIPLIDPFRVDNQYDGVIAASYFSGYPFRAINSTEIEAGLENLHSAGFITSICQTSNTYFHMMLVRHGSVFQVQDPWPTSWYGAVWRQSIPRDIALGYTVGEAYTRGISHVGIQYLTDPPQWWWDIGENVVYFGDPDLRMYVPATEYSNDNNWDKTETNAYRYDEELSIDGHMPFGATDHPKARQENTWLNQYMFLIVILAAIIILLTLLFIINKRKS
jgi:hypothetical protein